MAIRVELTGKTALHHQLLGNADRVREEFQARAINDTIDKAWIEKLKVKTSLPKQTAAGDLNEQLTDEAAREIDKYFAGLTGNVDELEHWSQTISPLLRKLPDTIASQLEFDTDTLSGTSHDEDGPTLFDKSDEDSDSQRMARDKLIDLVRALLVQQFREHQRS